MKVNLKINNMVREFDITPGEILFDVLKKAGISSVKKSCGESSCGVCTVLLDGKPIHSCSYLAVKAEGHNVTTVEGEQEEVEKLGELMNKEGAIQCGFCTPGFVLTTIAMKRELENPNEDEIKSYLVANLCRCSGYEGQLRAVKRYVGVSE